MGILDRIRKFFSRSGSSSNSRDPFRHGPTSHRNDGFNNVVQHSYQVQQNRHFNVSNIHTSSQRSANVRVNLLLVLFIAQILCQPRQEDQIHKI